MRSRKKRSFIYCWDGDDFSLVPERPTEAALVDKIFAPLEGAAVDTIFFVLGVGNFAEYPSEVLGIWGESQQFQFNSAGSYRRYAAVRHLIDNGTDPCEMVIRASRDRGIDAFFAFRMNDIHDHWAEFSDILPMFKKENPHWLHPKERFPDFHGNHEIGTALNYEVREVRDLRLRTLREVIGKYDFDGVELDFMRGQFYFHWDEGVSSAYIMTDFVREVRELLDEIGARRGRTIELAVRVCTTVIGSRMAGFDVERWAKEGLIDIVIAGTGGLNIDTEEYKRILAGTGVSFFPCLYGDYEKTTSSIESMRGAAEMLLSRGPDGIYAFNMYPEERGRMELMKEIGSLATLKGLDKTYFVDVDYDYILTREEWRYRMHLPATLAETSREPLIVPVQAGEDLTAYADVRIRLIVFIKDLSAEDVYEFRFNGRELKMPEWGHHLADFRVNAFNKSLSWELRAEEVQPWNEFSVRLARRNPHLVRYAPAILERINIEVQFGGIG